MCLGANRVQTAEKEEEFFFLLWLHWLLLQEATVQGRVGIQNWGSQGAELVDFIKGSLTSYSVNQALRKTCMSSYYVNSFAGGREFLHPRNHEIIIIILTFAKCTASLNFT